MFLVRYTIGNPDQNHNGTSYDCFSGGKDIIGADGQTYNFGIKANNSNDFIYPDPDVLTPEMAETFTTNVTNLFINWFIWGVILQGVIAVAVLIFVCTFAIVDK